MPSLYFDGDLKRIYEVPVNSSYTVDVNGYRIYVPDDIPGAETAVNMSATVLWSRYVDWRAEEEWALEAFNKEGGAFRRQDEQGNDIFATFDIRLINDWQLVPANYPHKWTILGNLFENIPAGTDFDTDRITALGVSPRIFYSDSLQTITTTGGNTGNVWDEDINGIPARDRLENTEKNAKRAYQASV